MKKNNEGKTPKNENSEKEIPNQERISNSILLDEEESVNVRNFNYEPLNEEYLDEEIIEKPALGEKHDRNYLKESGSKGENMEENEEDVDKKPKREKKSKVRSHLDMIKIRRRMNKSKKNIY